jgi:hypothetical protein
MPFNYLPFAQRVYLPGNANRVTVPREAFSSGMGRKAYLSDLSIDFLIDSRGMPPGWNYEWNGRVNTANTLIRMGIFGRPYMTEEFYPVALYGDMPADDIGVWRLPKPYTLFPGERLKARVVYSPGGAVQPLPSDAYDGYWATWPSISFFGIKRNTQHPCVLYDTFPSTFAAALGTFVTPPLGTPTILMGERLQCPKDSPVDIYAVKDSMGDSSGNSPHATQIYSPDGRKWWENDNWPMMLCPTYIIKNLNKPEWVLEPDETIQIEVINPPIIEIMNQMVLTLRGQVEVAI